MISAGLEGIEMELLARLCDLKGEVALDLIGLRVGEPAMAKLFVIMLPFWLFEKKAIFDLTSAATPMSEPLLEVDSFSLRYAGIDGDCGMRGWLSRSGDICCRGVPGPGCARDIFSCSIVLTDTLESLCYCIYAKYVCAFVIVVVSSKILGEEELCCCLSESG